MVTVASRDLHNRPLFFSKADAVDLMTHRQADPGLSRELEQLAGDTTDDLDAL